MVESMDYPLNNRKAEVLSNGELYLIFLSEGFEEVLTFLKFLTF